MRPTDRDTTKIKFNRVPVSSASQYTLIFHKITETMRKRFHNSTAVKLLCVSIPLCFMAAGAQAIPAPGSGLGMEVAASSEVSGTQQSTKKVSGVVIDEAGIPIIGANVIEKGTTIARRKSTCSVRTSVIATDFPTETPFL